MTTKTQRSNWKSLLVLFFFLSSLVIAPMPQATAAAGTPYLVKDLYPGTTGSSPSSFFMYNDQLIFRAKINDTTYGAYSTDGTESGTKLITPLTSTSPFMLTYGISGYENYLGALAFTSEQTLYMSQGTAETLATFDFFAPLYYHPWKINAVKAVKDKLFFVANGIDGSTSPYTFKVQLWAVTDRVVSHAHLVKTIFNQTNDLSNNPTQPSLAYAAGNLLFFVVKTGAGTWELWRSDGTTDGTFKVSAASVIDYSNPLIVEYHGLVYFRGGDETLWVTDGTVAGTHQVFDHKNVLELKVINDRLYFAAYTGEKGPGGLSIAGFYTSDGTTAGTQHLNGFDEVPYESYIISLNGHVLLSDGFSIWLLIGSSGEAQKLYDVTGPYNFSLSQYPIFNGYLYFLTGSTGKEIWRTDGTASGTSLFYTLPSNISFSIPYLNNGLLYFVGSDAAAGSELWAMNLGEPSTPCSYETEVPLAECQALVGLYNGIGGPNWTRQTNWLTTNTPSNWSGVGISGGHVTSLNLAGNQLTGDIPDQLADLTQLTSLDLGFNSLTVPQPYPSDPPTALQTFLGQKDPDWYKTQAAAKAIDASGGQLISRDGNVDMTVPANALNSTVTLNYLPQPAPKPETGSLAFAGRSFRLEVSDALGNPQGKFDFAAPVKVTLSYSDQNVMGIDEDSLLLYYWDTTSSTWKDASSTCDPHSEYIRDLKNNKLTTNICHLTEFGIFGTPLYPVYMPALMY